MTRLKWWQGVVAKVDTAFHAGELYCDINPNSYRIHLSDSGNIWDVRWHIDRHTGRIPNHYVFVNSQLEILNHPDLIGELEEIGKQLATMKKMMTT